MHRLGRLFRIIVQFFLDIVETVVVGLAMFVVIYLFLVQPHQVNGNSMWPNFLDGEYLLTDKFSYRLREPKRGDVIIFLAPSGARCPQELHCDFVKRIIGLPAERVVITEGKIFINGTQLTESYIPSDPGFFTATTNNSLDVVLGPEDYFVLGDNRGHSSDSRAWGTVPRDNIVGRAWFRYWPPKRLGFIADAAYR